MIKICTLIQIELPDDAPDEDIRKAFAELADKVILEAHDQKRVLKEINRLRASHDLNKH